MLSPSAIGGAPIASFIVDPTTKKNKRDFFVIYLVGYGDISADYKDRSLRGSATLNGRAGCQFILTVDQGAGTNPVPIKIGSEIHITSRQGLIFSGSIDQIDRTIVGDTSKQLQLTVKCVDFNQVADRKIVIAAFESETQTLGDIARTLHTNFLAVDDIAIGTIEDGPSVNKVIFNYITVAQAFDKLTGLTGGAFTWIIDNQKRLHFFSRTTFTAPFDLDATSAATDVAIGLTESMSRDLYRNRQYLIAGQDIADPRTETFEADGETRTFTVQLPVAAKPSITVGGSPVDASDIGINGIDDTLWLYQTGEKQVSKNTDETAPANGVVVQITYQGFVPTAIVLERKTEIVERSGIEGGSGVYENVVQDDSILEQNTARQRTDALLDQFTKIPSRISYRTESFGLRPGHLQNVDIPDLILDASYLVESTKFAERGDWDCRMSVTATEGSDILADVEFFKKLVMSGRKFIFNENQVLLQPVSEAEVIDVNDSLTVDQADSTIGVENDEFSIWIVGSTVPFGRSFVDGSETVVVGPAIGAPQKWP